MKKNVISFLFIVFCLINFYQANAQFNINSGLIAYYPFSGNANDASGNGMNGTVNGATLISDRFGNSNSAYEFDGSNDYISISYNSLLNLTGDKSVSFWYYLPTTNVNPDATILVIKNGSSAYYPTLYIAQLEDVTYGSGRYKNSFFFGKSSTNYQLNTKQLYTNYVKQWVHIVATYSQSSGYSKIYFNGVISDSLYVGNITSNSTNSDIQIGRNDGNSRNHYRGYLDDIRLYNRELTKDEVAYLYNESLVNIDKVSSVTICNNNDSIKVNYTKKNKFDSNNIIEFQLSDSNGDFTNYYSLKTSSNNSKGSDSVYLKMPLNIPTSNFYRLKIVTNSPSNEIIWGTDIQVFPKPTSDFIIQNDSQCLSGNMYSFVNQSSIKNGFMINTWYFGDNTNDNAISPIKSYTKTGNFNVKLLVESDKGCKDSMSIIITVKQSPEALFFINNPEQCFRNNEFKIANQSSIPFGKIKLFWSFGDGDTSTKLNPEHQYDFKGKYKVSLKATADNGCSDTSSKTVIVNEQPKALFIVDEENQCFKNHTFNFFDLSVYDGVGLNYRWSFGDKSNDTSENPIKKYKDTGVYFVKLVITSKRNCTDTFEQMIKLSPSPSSLMMDIKNDVCFGDSVIFKIKDFNNAYHYKWLRNDTFLGDTTENFYTIKRGNIKLITTNKENCSDTSSSISTIYKPSPIKPIITRIDRILNAGPDYATYQWYLNNQILSGETNQFVEISINGIYAVQVSNEDKCANESNYISVANAGIFKSIQNKISVYPNPTNGIIKVDTEIASKIEVYDLQGRLVKSISTFETKHELSLENMEAGIYIIKIITENSLVSNAKVSLIK